MKAPVPSDIAYCHEHRPVEFSEYLREWKIRGCPGCAIDRLRAENAELRERIAAMNGRVRNTATNAVVKAPRDTLSGRG